MRVCLCVVYGCVGVGVHACGVQRLTQDVFLITYHLIFVVVFFFFLFWIFRLLQQDLSM